MTAHESLFQFARRISWRGVCDAFATAGVSLFRSLPSIQQAERDGRIDLALRRGRKIEDAAMQLALVAEDVNEHIMSSGLAWRRQRLDDEILNVKLLVEEARTARRGGTS